MKRCRLLLFSAVLASVAGLGTATELDNGALNDQPQATNVVYVTSFDSDSVLRFNADTGAFLGVFVPPGSGGLNGPTGLAFGPDGHLYVGSFVFNNRVLDSVMKFDSQTGEWMGTFAMNCFGPEMIAFGPNGDLYVASYHGDSVDRFDGQTGAWKDTMWGNGLAGPVDIAFRRLIRTTEPAP